MFDLTAAELSLRILDCAGGPASFNVEMTRQGYNVISCDPIYEFTASAISTRLQETYQPLIDQVKANVDNYVWQNIKSPEELGQIRMSAMQHFLEDLPLGIQQGRYVTSELPILPFKDKEVDLALCSHFLFLYSDLLSEDFHIASILELCRVAKEVRIFPLLKLSGEPSILLQPVRKKLEAHGYSLEIKQVPYEFQKGGDRMLRIFCPVPPPLV
jgi:hypothetical protein